MSDRISVKCWMAMEVGDLCLLMSVLVFRVNRRMARVVAREIEERRN